ncbi:hypothetical protein SAMN05421818_10279 [Myroides phaeus]|uniref:Uncharacterized protein n=1 Tax=Myroides phaeus TaxID=702745 RepID=A0A1G8BIA3_9FLAO|nr:hypothetical protein SAMN05421818_10279 [Myroides phaeus]
MVAYIEKKFAIIKILTFLSNLVKLIFSFVL